MLLVRVLMTLSTSVVGVVVLLVFVVGVSSSVVGVVVLLVLVLVLLVL